jgi:zinc D-Ala-D-Ala carboxypeptidase
MFPGERPAAVNLSQHFSLADMTFSQEAARRGWSNNPSYVQAEALKNLCVHILEPLRDYTGLPISVDSGFRNDKVNEIVGGDPISQHLRGEASDMRINGMAVSIVIATIRKLKLPFDQLIDEFGRWTHVSHCADRKNRGEVLTARIENGKKVYRPLP